MQKKIQEQEHKQKLLEDRLNNLQQSATLQNELISLLSKPQLSSTFKDDQTPLKIQEYDRRPIEISENKLQSSQSRQSKPKRAVFQEKETSRISPDMKEIHNDDSKIQLENKINNLENLLKGFIESQKTEKNRPNQHQLQNNLVSEFQPYGNPNGDYENRQNRN